MSSVGVVYSKDYVDMPPIADMRWLDRRRHYVQLDRSYNVDIYSTVWTSATEHDVINTGQVLS